MHMTDMSYVPPAARSQQAPSSPYRRNTPRARGTAVVSARTAAGAGGGGGGGGGGQAAGHARPSPLAQRRAQRKDRKAQLQLDMGHWAEDMAHMDAPPGQSRDPYGYIRGALSRATLGNAEVSDASCGQSPARPPAMLCAGTRRG